MEQDKLKILVIDDEMHIRLIIRAYLAPYNTDIIEAKDGKEGLEIMRNTKVDLVIVDFAMPMMSGLEVIENMINDEQLSMLPVILYTAGGFEKEMENKMKRTATAFLEKTNLGHDLIPILTDILGDRLKKA
jgi:CheY-like chemotaxis protein